MKIIFFGSDDFALAHLEHLVLEGYEICACVTQPDRPRGRGMRLIFSPIKEYSLKNNIPVIQPERLKNLVFVEELKVYDADLFVVIAYGRILPADVLDVPRLFAINVHGSLLPRYRGAAPINWAIINGEKQTGITIIRLNPKMDAGDIIEQVTVEINQDDTAQSLRSKMCTVGKCQLIQTIESIKKGAVHFVLQDENAVSFAPKLTRQLGRIDWNQPAVQINNLVRGLYPKPAAHTIFNGKVLKILHAECLDELSDRPAGELIAVEVEGMKIATKEGVLLVQTVHLESSKQLPAEEFVRGVRILPGFSFA